MNAERARRAVFTFCVRRDLDPTAGLVLDGVIDVAAPEPIDISIDGHPVLVAPDAHGNELVFVATDDVVSHDYARYAPELARHFADADFAGVVNWHEGDNAPDRVLLVHSTGDVPSGTFAPADPLCMRSLLRAFETERVKAGLDDWMVGVEGTHWSGTRYGFPPEAMLEFPAPMVDIEIGSSPASWRDGRAVAAVAHALMSVFAPGDHRVASLLAIGGVHLEASFSGPVVESAGGFALAISHVLPNQWVVGNYDGPDAAAKLDRCAASIVGGVSAVVVHDKLKAAYKDGARELAARLDVPVFKHQRLRTPSELPLW